MSNLIGQTLLNQFRVDAFLASGGMGSVYRVWDIKRNVPLAMKTLHSDLAEDPHIFKQFEREARALKRLTHPNIVPFYGLYDAGEFVFLLQRFIDGPSLATILKQQKSQPLPLQQTLTYFRALASALGYAHANGVIHCDVKPGNLLVDRGGNIYLTDFGIARHAESTVTTMAAAGTPAYMAPEQILGQTVTAATDIYAMGIVLFELLTGQRPFRGNEPDTSQAGPTFAERIRYGHLHLSPPDPSSINPSIPSNVACVVLKCLEKMPENRYSNVQELLMTVYSAFQVDWNMVSERVPVSLPGHNTTPLHGERSVSTRSPWFLGTVIVGLVVCLGIFALVGRGLYSKILPTALSPAVFPSQVGLASHNPIEETPKVVSVPSLTFVPTVNSLPSPSPEPTATEVSYKKNERDGADLVYISAGNFSYGTDAKTDLYFIGAEIPEHTIYLDEYLIYRTEVTNVMYERCVQEKQCPRPEKNNSRTISSYYGNPRYADYPVIFVSWVSAQSYCVWAGGKLPTEAQWEKAARGEDGRLFPWGNSNPVSGQVNLCDGKCADAGNQTSFQDNYIDVAPVGAHPASASPYGVLDMSGNVWEWVYDWMQPGYLSSDDNPLGPASGTRRVVRGGSWRSNLGEIRTVIRISVKPSLSLDTTGFRCVINQ